MLECRRCRNWVDQTFAQLQEQSQNGHAGESVFYGCRIFGMLESTQVESCPHYEESQDLYAFCSSCGIAVPKICLSLGECVNCTDTDLYCVENCHGEGEKKFCSHFQRLLRDGHTLIENNECFEIFPTQAGAAPSEPTAPIISLFPEKTDSKPH